MNNGEKRKFEELVRRYHEAARQEFPLPESELAELFDILDSELPRHGCDNTLRLTKKWLEDRGHAIEPVVSWLQHHGGYCDCEVLLNVKEHFKENKGDL